MRTHGFAVDAGRRIESRAPQHDKDFTIVIGDIPDLLEMRGLRARDELAIHGDLRRHHHPSHMPTPNTRAHEPPWPVPHRQPAGMSHLGPGTSNTLIGGS